MPIILSQSENQIESFSGSCGRGELFQFTCLPNGLAEAPRKFTKVLKVPFTKLREQGHSSSAYLDDLVLFGATHQDCADNVRDTMVLLDKVGFMVHPDKSIIEPSHVLVYLGFVLDSLKMRVLLTQERQRKIIDVCLKLLGADRVTIRFLAEAVGMMVAVGK